MLWTWLLLIHYMFQKWNKLRLLGKQKLTKVKFRKENWWHKKNFKEAIYIISIFYLFFYWGIHLCVAVCTWVQRPDEGMDPLELEVQVDACGGCWNWRQGEKPWRGRSALKSWASQPMPRQPSPLSSSHWNVRSVRAETEQAGGLNESCRSHKELTIMAFPST